MVDEKFKVLPYQKQFMRDVENGKVKRLVFRKSRTKKLILK